MRKRINGSNKKNNVKYFVVIVFILFISLTLSLINRKEMVFEELSKTLSSNISEFFIFKLYPNNKLSNAFSAARYNYLIDENKKLKDMLNLTSNDNNFISAEVTIHNARLWFDKIYINKGRKDLVYDGSVVVESNGVIGFVEKSYDSISEVSLLTSANSNNMVSVVIETDKGNISGILTKYDTFKKMYVISDITSKDNIPPGSTVLLSGYNDDRINGILIGYVAKEETDSYGLSKKVWVKTNVDFNNLMFVAVMVK